MPGHKCIVPTCFNRKEEGAFSFFQFPNTDDSRYPGWCAILGFEPSPEVKNKLICHSHFDSASYKIKRTLLPSAAPLQRSSNSSALGDVSNTCHRVAQRCADENSLKRKDEEAARDAKRIKASNSFLRTKLLQEETKPVTAEKILQHFSDAKTFKYLMKMQFERYGTREKAKYDDMEKTLALTLYYSCGTKGYSTLLHIGFRLPTLSTIRRWICRLDFRPGRSVEILNCLKEKVAIMNDKEKDCVLTLDETSLTKLLIYNTFTDEFEGIQDFGGKEKEMKLADYALVLMVCGQNTRWSMPLSFHFSKSSTTVDKLYNIVNDCLKDLFAIGLRVRVVVTDQGGCNQGMFKRFGATVNEPYSVVHGFKVMFMFDPPHLVKNLRNNLLKGPFALDGEEYDIDWKHILDFYEKDKAGTVRACSKLTDDHFELNNFTKMNVSRAAQVLSHSTAAGMYAEIRAGNLPESYSVTADFVDRVDKIFDRLNISKEYEALKKWKSGRLVFQNRQNYKEDSEWVSKLSKAGTNEVLPCMKGLQMTLNATYLLLEDLKTEGYGYFFTRKNQSDRIEHFFSFLKQRTGSSQKPTAQQFRRSFRYLFITNLMRSPEGANCEQFEESESIHETMRKLHFLLSKAPIKTSMLEDSPNIQEQSDNEYESDFEDSNDEDRTDYNTNSYFKGLEQLQSNTSSVNAAVYMGCWATKKVLKKTNCSNCKSLLEFSSQREVPGLDSDEVLTFYKAYDETIFTRDLNNSFGELSAESVKPVFHEFAEIIAKASYESFNLLGTHVMKNISREVRKTPAVRLWLETEDLSDDCKNHRRQIIELMIRARLFDVVKLMNSEERAKEKQKKQKIRAQDKRAVFRNASDLSEEDPCSSANFQDSLIDDLLNG